MCGECPAVGVRIFSMRLFEFMCWTMWLCGYLGMEISRSVFACAAVCKWVGVYVFICLWLVSSCVRMSVTYYNKTNIKKRNQNISFSFSFHSDFVLFLLFVSWSKLWILHVKRDGIFFTLLLLLLLLAGPSTTFLRLFDHQLFFSRFFFFFDSFSFKVLFFFLLPCRKAKSDKL